MEETSKFYFGLYQIMRIPVVSRDNQPLMPTTPARARKWIESGKAVKCWSDGGQFYLRLTVEPSGDATQDIVIGIDPGKHYSGIGYVSGDTEKQISVSDANWKRLGQIASSKVKLIRRSTGLIVSC